MYKAKLIALLEGLECRNIGGLIEASPEHLRTVGITIAKYAKIGAESDTAVLTSAMHSDGEGLAALKNKEKVNVVGTGVCKIPLPHRR